MTLNELEQVETGGKEDKPIDIFLDNKSAVDMSSSFKDTKRSRHILRRWHYVRAGVQSKWHLLTWMSNEAQVADMMTKILPRKGLLSKLIYALVKIDRE